MRWFPNGQIAMKGFYSNGRRMGTWWAWDQQGNVLPEMHYLRPDNIGDIER